MLIVSVPSQSLDQLYQYCATCVFKPHLMHHIDAAYCYTCRTFCYVGHISEPCKNRRTDGDAVLGAIGRLTCARNHVLDGGGHIAACGH